MKKNGLFTKLASVLMVCMMLVSILPVMAAEETDGFYWRTIETVSFDGFTTTTPTPKQGYYASGTVADRTVHIEAHCENWSYGVGSATGLTGGVSFVNDGLYAGGAENTPSVLKGNGYRIWHDWNNPRWASPLQSHMFYNLFDTDDVKIGDKVRITAWILPCYSRKWERVNGAFVGAEPEAPVEDRDNSIRMFLAQKQDDLSSFPKGFTTSYNAYNPNVTSEQPDEYVKATLKNNEWNEISITYDITAENKNIASIRFDQNECFDSYAGVAVIAGFKIEKQVSDEDLTYGDYTKTLAETNFDGFTASTSTPKQSYYATGTVDGRTVYGESHCENWSYAVGSSAGITNGLGFLNDAGLFPNSKVNIPEILKGNGYLIWNAYNSNNNKWSTPSQSSMFYNLFDTSEVKVGDTVKITTWIYPSYTYKWERSNGAYVGDPVRTTDTTNNIRMFLSQKSDGNSGVTKGITTDYNAYNPNYTDTQPDEFIKATLTNGQWNEISITYDITELNKDIASIRIDQTECFDAFAGVAAIAGFKVEKIVEAGGTFTVSESTVTGTVDAGVSVDMSGIQAKVIIAAYNGDVFLGCKIVDYTEPGEYDFEIENAKGANKVKAYIWDMSRLAAKVYPINLTAAQ